MKIKAAIFDMDGTLVDSLIFWNLFWGRMGEKYFGDKSFCPHEDDDKRIRTMTLKDAIVLVHEKYHFGESAEELFELTHAMITDFYTNEVELKDGVKEFLEHLRAQGTKMCIASASAADLVALAIERCNIGHYFAKIFSCSTVGKDKSEPDVFLQAAQYLGEDVSQTWVFEDSLVAIETAVKVGMPTVGIFDRNNFGQDRIKEISREYIAEGETLEKLI